MTINLRAPELKELKPRITVLGVGGAGGNAVNNMINAKLEGVTFVVANTDAQALAQSKAEHKIQLGAKLTEGLGAGAKPEIGRGAAEETMEEIIDYLEGSHMVFVTAGMGGGTGTGAAPVIARAVRERGMLTVGVVTKPFHFEGDKRMRVAERGIEEMQGHVDTLIVIPNQNLFRVATERTTFAQAFAMADDVLHSGVRGITDLIVIPGLINRDFADIRTVMSEMGKAMMGTGEMDGEGRALRAAEAAISNPLLDDVSMKGARAVLINVTGGPDMMLFEVDEAVNRIRAEVDTDASIVFGSALSETMEGRIRVSVVATGIDAESVTRISGNVQSLFPRPQKPVETPAAQPAAQTAVQPAPRTGTDSSPVHMARDTIANELGAQTERLLNDTVAGDRSAVAAMFTEDEELEPMELGDIDSPIIEEEDGSNRPMRDTRQPPRERRGMFGLFGRRRAEKQEPMLDTQEAMRPARTAKAASQPIGRTQGEAPRPQPKQQPQQQAAQQAAAVSPRAAAEGLRQQKAQPGEDLFDGVTADDRFEIPAFLRRQANTGT
jgi:cell division protein FtsZ